MELYRCDLFLEDYLFFATTERGNVAETGPFVHNYALTYALDWAKSPWRNEEQKPSYRSELAQVGLRYLTPARLVQGAYLVNQYNTMSESYSLGKGQSIGYPSWGFIKCFRPGGHFQFYALSQTAQTFPLFIRLGKFMTKTRLKVTPATKIKYLDRPSQEYEKMTHPLLNWEDLAPDSRPSVYDILPGVLPSRLVDNAFFMEKPGPFLRVSFPNEAQPVELPLQMGYFGTNLCATW